MTARYGIRIFTLATAAAMATACGTTGGTDTAAASLAAESHFQGALALYRQAEGETALGLAARTAGDVATAEADFTAAVGHYGQARDAFAQLVGSAAWCPTVSNRCDNAAYLAGRSSYEIGMIQHDLGLLALDPIPFDTAAQGALADGRDRLEAMLNAFPASGVVDNAAYFAGRARFELTNKYGVGRYAEAEPLFARSRAANGAGTWADNALYYEGRCAFEEGLLQAAAEAAAVAALPIDPADPGYAAALVPATAAYVQGRADFGRTVTAEGSLLSGFALSSYADNASYYLGRAWFERPTPDEEPGVTPGAVSDAERMANLANAVTELSAVVATPTSTYADAARYWRGRARYAESFHPFATPDKATRLPLAIGDFRAVAVGSTWRDNALLYAVKSQIRLADLTGACAEYAAMNAELPWAAGTFTERAKIALDAFLASTAQTCP
jgi:tetratricopeptide (TPR) repeat protein